MHLEDYRLFDTKVFRDVVHDYIRVEYMPIWKLINTKEFQRLRRIKQLGGTSMVFPSAEHSRFVHSLGVYEITRQMTELDQVKNHLTDYERLTVLCAALLHDLGHGPFSHSFEGIFQYNHEMSFFSRRQNVLPSMPASKQIGRASCRERVSSPV